MEKRSIETDFVLYDIENDEIFGKEENYIRHFE
jgi:hypothetical protein